MCFYNGSGSRDRTYDIFVNSEAQLPAVLFRNKFGAVDGNRTRLNLIDNQVPYPEDYNGLNLCWVGAPAPIVLILSHGPCLASCTGIDPVPSP